MATFRTWKDSRQAYNKHDEACNLDSKFVTKLSITIQKKHSKITSKQTPKYRSSNQQNDNTQFKNLEINMVIKVRRIKKWRKIPQILIGASSSNKLGCCKKISLETAQSWRISDSDSCTCFPGRPRTSSNRLIMSSRTAWSIFFVSIDPKKKKSQRLYWTMMRMLWWWWCEGPESKNEREWNQWVNNMPRWRRRRRRREREPKSQWRRFASRRVSFEDHTQLKRLRLWYERVSFIGAGGEEKWQFLSFSFIRKGRGFIR